MSQHHYHHHYAHYYDTNASGAETSGHSSRNGRSARGLELLAVAAEIHAAHRVSAQGGKSQGYSTNTTAYAGQPMGTAGGYVYALVHAPSAVIAGAHDAYNTAYSSSVGTSDPSSQYTALYQQHYPGVSAQYPSNYASSVPAPAVAQQNSVGNTLGAYPAMSYTTAAVSGSQQQTQRQAQIQTPTHVGPADAPEWWNQDLTNVRLPDDPVCARQGSQELSDEETEQQRHGHESHSEEKRGHRPREGRQRLRR